MGYFDGLYSGVASKIGAAKGIAASNIKGVFSGALREGQAGIKLSAQRGGYSGSPVEAALKRKFAGQLAGQEGQALGGLESNYLNQLGTLEAQQAQLKAQEKMNADISNQQFWGNIVQGAGSLFGSVGSKLGWFGPQAMDQTRQSRRSH